MLADLAVAPESAGAEPTLRLEPAVIKSLSRRSLWRSVAAIAFQWATIAMCIWVAEISTSYIVLILCLFVIATRQHAFAALLHEGCHYNLCESKALNDFLSNVFCAFPISISVKRYRNNHLAHHRMVNEETDPDIVENTPPQSLRELVLLVAGDLCFLSIPKNAKRARKFGVFKIFKEEGPSWRTERYLYLAFVATVIVSATYFGVWKQVLLFWFVPQFSFLQAISRLRGYAEHAGLMEETVELHKTRTVDANLIETFIFAPASVNRHLEHHLYPSVPFFNLEKLHRLLLEKAGKEKLFTSTRGYLRPTGLRSSVFGEIYFRKPSSAPAE
jgi:fatty acid desaturase